jgi:hypothetical protein
VKPIRVWFNRTFSSSYHAVSLIRDNPDGWPVQVYGTHETLDAVFLGACDHASVEPTLRIEDYLDHALDFCAFHRIKAFVPKRFMVPIAGRREDFEARGTGLLVAGSPRTIAAVGDKGHLYDMVERLCPGWAPRHRVVRTAAEFAAAHAEIAVTGAQVCFKPAQGEGGGGFRIIDDSRSPLTALADYPSERIPLAVALAALGSVESFPPLVVSEVLAGAEYSLDCLARDGELLVAVPRRKLDRRTQRIEDAPELVEVARAVAAEFRLKFLFNIQFMVGRDGPKVIDVNPRMSAGIDTAAASGVNLPWLGLRLLLEGDVAVPTPRYGITIGRISHVVTVADDSGVDLAAVDEDAA